jgi:tRNA dimethylallyltransferase
MMEMGLEDEARKLMPYRHLNALNTVGYSELFDYFDGKITRNEAIEKIKQNTRRFAKRQLTWFRKDPEINWFEPGEAITIV